MSINLEEAGALVKQQKIAHRLIAGIYQNILASFDNLGSKCDFVFDYWWPTWTNRPCQSKTNPTTKWIWDFLPLYASTFRYKMLKEPPNALPGNSLLVFRLYCDEGFRKENRKGGYIDPVDLDSKDGSVEIMVYRCIEPDSQSFSDLYDAEKFNEEKQWLNPFVEGWQKTSSSAIMGYYKRYLLEDFITGQENIEALIKELTSEDYVMPEI